MRLLLIPVLAVAVLAAAPAGAQDPPPPTNARVLDDFGTSGKRVVVKLRVTGAVVGTSARATCAGGKAKGCPPALRGRAKTITAKRAGLMSLEPALRGNRLAKGAVVIVTLRDPGALFRRTTVTVESSSRASVVTRCEQPGGGVLPCGP